MVHEDEIIRLQPTGPTTMEIVVDLNLIPCETLPLLTMIHGRFQPNAGDAGALDTFRGLTLRCRGMTGSKRTDSVVQ